MAEPCFSYSAYWLNSRVFSSNCIFNLNIISVLPNVLFPTSILLLTSGIKDPSFPRYTYRFFFCPPLIFVIDLRFHLSPKFLFNLIEVLGNVRNVCSSFVNILILWNCYRISHRYLRVVGDLSIPYKYIYIFEYFERNW